MNQGAIVEANFWINRWETNQIGFHLSAANPLLVKHFNALSLPKGSRVFLPLCGKTLDIAWLLGQGHRVVGAELVEVAIIQLFEELGVKPEVKEVGKLKLYSAPHLDIFVGDIFNLDQKTLGKVDAVYDRAALVALPEEMRRKYTTHLKTITQQAPQLLITFEYDQSLFSGPPFSVNSEEIQRHYAKGELIEVQDLPGGIRGQYPAKECAWKILG